jgi:hypothetical protein
MSSFIVPITPEELREALSEADREAARYDEAKRLRDKKERARIRAEELLQEHRANQQRKAERVEELMRQHRERQRLKVLNDLQRAADEQQAMIERVIRRARPPVITPATRKRWQNEVDPNRRKK